MKSANSSSTALGGATSLESIPIVSALALIESSCASLSTTAGVLLLLQDINKRFRINKKMYKFLISMNVLGTKLLNLIITTALATKKYRNFAFETNKQKSGMNIKDIQNVLNDIKHLEAHDEKEIENLRIKYLSRKGEISKLMSEFRNVEADKKREYGIKLNELKKAATDKINALRNSISTSKDVNADIDLTRTASPVKLGTSHPLSLVKNQIINIFGRMGFVLADGPEVEDDWHVFSSMNFPADHPARDMQDTFFVENPNILLRTHTSSVQSRVMEVSKPPIRVICPGRVYRNEAISARAHCFFHQVEGLYVDEKVSFADLKQVLLTFSREMFGPDTKIRLRPSYFPFTEPSAEMDINCDICGGKGCSFCKHTGWVEILGCGMVDPAVLDANGIDSSKYTGYAFGMGIERIANLKYKVDDLRLFSENDVRFLEEFSSAY